MRNVRASAGALAALIGLLLREVNLDMSRINGGAKVDGSQGVIGASPLTDQRGGGFRLLIALTLHVTLVFSLVL